MLPQLPRPVHRPSIARAAVSPTAIGVTAAGVAIGAAEHSVLLMVVLGAGAWMARVAAAAVARLRRRAHAAPAPDIDPWALPEPWRDLVRQAVGAQERLESALGAWPPGPLRDRLGSVQADLRRQVADVWEIARRGAALEGWPAARAGAPSAAELSERLSRTQAERRALERQAPAPREALARTEEALAAQLRAARRAEETSRAFEDRLRLLTARFDEAVTSILQLGVEGVEGVGDRAVADAGRSVDALTDEVTALREGLAEVVRVQEAVGSPPAAGGPALPPAGAPPAAPGP